MESFELMPSSPVTHTETHDESFEIQIKQEHENGIVRPVDVFPPQMIQEATKARLICHSYQFSHIHTINEALLPDNITISGETPAISEIIEDAISSDIISSFAMSYDLNQSIVFTSDDFLGDQKKWPLKSHVHDNMSELLILEKNQHFDKIKTESEYEDEILIDKSLMVVIRLRAKKEFLQVLEMSGPAKEYKLPIFHTLQPLNAMKKCAKYRSSKVIPSHSEVSITSTGSMHRVIIKRYDSRLTLGQLALVLGLQKYKVSLVKDIESAVVAMFDQLCGFRIGHGTWCRGIPRKERQDMISRVFEYAKIYFPSFSRDIIQIIIKRGAYSRTQEFLRRERRRKARYHF